MKTPVDLLKDFAPEFAQNQMDERALVFESPNYHEPAVAAYLQAQADVVALFRAAGDQLSRDIGLSFAAACSSGCC